MLFSRFSLPLSAVLLVGTSLPLAAEQSGITASLDAGVLNIKATETFYNGSHKTVNLTGKQQMPWRYADRLDLSCHPSGA